MGGISIWQLAIIAVIVILLFGTKKLRGLGGDLGGAIKGFKNAMSEDKTVENIEEKKTADNNSNEKVESVASKEKDQVK